MDNKIQFTSGDIIKKFENINTECDDSRQVSLEFIGHELRTTYNAIAGYSNLLSYDPVLVPGQRVYMDCIQNLTDSLLQSISNITTGYFRGPKNCPKERCVEYSKAMIEGLEDLIRAMPVSRKVLSVKELPDEEKGYLDAIDSGIEGAVYMHNLHFSPDFQRKEYRLDMDLKRYARQHQKKNHVSAVIKDPSMDQIQTGFDYLREAIIPIIKNVNDHAYSKDNPYSRTLPEDFIKEVMIRSKVDESNKTITISITDNGFGIHPDVKDSMFEQGASCRAEKTGHGIGLWCVKDKIERNGGKIWFDTMPREGTTFHFTIPYDRIDNSSYITECR